MQVVGYDTGTVATTESGSDGIRDDPEGPAPTTREGVTGTENRSVPGTEKRGGDETVETGAALLLADGGAIERVTLTPGRELSYTLGERRCAGALEGDEHVGCDRGEAPYCEAHDRTWICARCTGECLKAEMDCYQEHAVYLAAFAPRTFKVGVTKLSRLRTRFREQGADRGALLYRVENGRIAREIESELAATVPIPDAVRVSQKTAGLARRVDEDAWNRLLAKFDVAETFAFEYGLGLAATPVTETLASGTVRGTKGRLLVLERQEGTYAVDMRELVGYELYDGSPTRQLQSSLGAFE